MKYSVQLNGATSGQFFTPVPICKFIVSSLPLEQLIVASHEPLKTIDYACGSGHFLTEYAAQLPPLLQSIKRQSDAHPWHGAIVGIEKEDRLAKVAKVSAFMYGFEGIHILDADALVRHAEVKDAGFQVLVANPPFAVEDFLLTVPEEERERFALLNTVSDLGNKNVQCFFLERAQQLLAPGGVMGVIVPSSILSNTDGMHVATREILLKYFDFVAITELGGNTFGKTGTNTVVLFLRRKVQRPEPAEHFYNRVQDFFENWADEAKTGGGEYGDADVARDYCAHVGVDFNAYQSLLLGAPSGALLQTDIFKDYRRAFDNSTEAKKIRDNKKKNATEKQAELEARFVAWCRAREQDKLYYYMLAAHNSMPVLVIKSPTDNNAQQQFLGYEWSGAKGQEGIRYYGGDSVKEIQTPLFDASRRDNADKLSYWVQRNFEGQPLAIPAALQAYATPVRLTDLLEFRQVGFDKKFSLSAKAIVATTSQWPQKPLGDVATLNPTKTELKTRHSETKVSFVEMASVSEEGYITRMEVRELDELKKGSYTYFGENDIILAKITPCMENGKCALAKGLMNGIGMGSTEFHVIRTDRNQLLPEFAFVFLNRPEVRAIAEKNMTGASGHRRVPESFYAELMIPLPPPATQKKIVAECEAIDQAVAAARKTIENAQANIIASYAEVSKKSTQEIRLSNSDMFDISIGKRVLKTEINEQGRGIPVYSANVYDAFGYTEKTLLPDFDAPSVLWGIDGDWMVNYIAKDKAFYPTDHCGVLRVKSGDIHPRYLAMVLEEEGRRVRFSRSYRASMEAIKGLRLNAPAIEMQIELADVIEKAERDIAAAQAVIDVAPTGKQVVMQKYL